MLRADAAARALVIDRRDAWRDGAHALWLDETGVRRETDECRARRSAVGAEQPVAAGDGGEGTRRLIRCYCEACLRSAATSCS